VPSLYEAHPPEVVLIPAIDLENLTQQPRVVLGTEDLLFQIRSLIPKLSDNQDSMKRIEESHQMRTTSNSHTCHRQ